MDIFIGKLALNANWPDEFWTFIKYVDIQSFMDKHLHFKAMTTDAVGELRVMSDEIEEKINKQGKGSFRDMQKIGNYEASESTCTSNGYR